jgi:succinate dehydrogenase/fumarate reductase flavoprotein subunit
MEREFDVPAVNILDSIKTFNEAADPIRDLEPPRRESHTPLVEAPFWAIPSVAAITYTMGGLRVNEDMSVRGLGGTVFAAGADAGNVYEDVYGGGLGWGLVSGRRAGTAAAGEPAPVGVAAAGAAAA